MREFEIKHSSSRAKSRSIDVRQTLISLSSDEDVYKRQAENKG